MYIYHLHNYKQIGQEKYYNGVCIRFLMEDIIHAENNNLNWLDLIYGTASRYDLRSKIYPSFMTYKKWIELSKNYPKIILSLNFDIHSYKYKRFCKKVLRQFPRNKNIIVSAANECYEKRGEAEKVYQTALEVHQAIQETNRSYPIAFWNQKIKTSGEKAALETLLDDSRVKDLCKYFAFQSLGTTIANINKYVWIAKLKGFKIVDIEFGNLVSDFYTLEKRFKLIKSLEIEDLVILAPEISKELANNKNYSIWKKYTLSYDGIYKDKFRIIKYVQQFKTREGNIMIADEYKFEDKNDKVIDWIQDMLYHKGFLAHPIDFGNYDEKTEKAVKDWQEATGLVITGAISKYQIWLLVEQSDNSTKVFRQLMIYAS